MLFTLTFFLHLEVAQVGISWKFLQENLYVIDNKRDKASWQSCPPYPGIINSSVRRPFPILTLLTITNPLPQGCIYNGHG
jgi:hypothetical protein